MASNSQNFDAQTKNSVTPRNPITEITGAKVQTVKPHSPPNPITGNVVPNDKFSTSSCPSSDEAEFFTSVSERGEGSPIWEYPQVRNEVPNIKLVSQCEGCRQNGFWEDMFCCLRCQRLYHKECAPTAAGGWWCISCKPN